MRGGFVRGGHSRAHVPRQPHRTEQDQMQRLMKKVRKEGEGQVFTGEVTLVPREEDWMIGAEEEYERAGTGHKTFSEAVKGGKTPKEDGGRTQPAQNGEMKEDSNDNSNNKGKSVIQEEGGDYGPWMVVKRTNRGKRATKGNSGAEGGGMNVDGTRNPQSKEGTRFTILRENDEGNNHAEPGMSPYLTNQAHNPLTQHRTLSQQNPNTEPTFHLINQQNNLTPAQTTSSVPITNDVPLLESPTKQNIEDSLQQTSMVEEFVPEMIQEDENMEDHQGPPPAPPDLNSIGTDVMLEAIRKYEETRPNSPQQSEPIKLNVENEISLGIQHGSSAFNVPLIKHDVFVSFRGIDIRTSFLSHLTKDLHRNQIDFFVDDKKLHPGDEISPTLLRAIEQSYISLVIFSKHYASSRWCMEELVKIIECMEQYERIVIPVFYNVDPSHVRHQKGILAEAFDVHKERYEEEIMQSWKSVLKKTANLSGIHYPSKYRNESELIEDIVKNISEKLSHLLSNASESLIGIDEKLNSLERLMEMDPEEVRILGIWGMGGIGKTTIARAIFDRCASRYEGCCFLQNVREELQKSGEHSLYEKLISELLEGEHLLVKGSAHARSMYVKRRLSRKKVFIVLDDVDTLDILDYLIIKQICLAPGSRVIITTRDEQLTAARVHAIYKVQVLSFKSSLELFCLKAFNKSYPENGYKELSEMTVNYTKGNPLALKVLGSFLHSRSIKEWESALRKLKVHPNVDIYNVLKLSYDGLDDSDKNIFLDIAFFFRGEYKDNA
ncbi:hypothetical protein AHAS_Ahas02G0235800 [Arachis hypogaea]